jgi:hypothetical protein
MLKSRDTLGESSVMDPGLVELLIVEDRRGEVIPVSFEGDMGTRLSDEVSMDPLQELSSDIRASIRVWSEWKSVMSL